MFKLILLCAVLCSCSAAQQKTVNTVETDLCKARATFRVLELDDSSLVPATGSARAEVEKLEDVLCAL